MGLPDATELEAMFRVRLQGRLAAERLDEVCALALGSTGADVERIVKDALRGARHENRSIELADLRRALTIGDDRNDGEIRRTAFHEAGHLLMEIVHFGGAEYIHATVTASGQRGGVTIRSQMPPFAGTYDDYRKRLQILLAGRAAEELEYAASSHGAGGRGSDLERAASIAAAMVGSFGICGDASLLYLGSQDETDKLMSYPEIRRAARIELARASEAARAVLQENRAALQEFAEIMLREGKLDGVSASAILRKSTRADRLRR